MTAFPDDPNPMFNSYYSSASLPTTSDDPTHHTLSYCSNWNQPEPIETNSVAIQTDDKTWDTQTDCQLTASLWSTELAIAEFEQQKKNLLIELDNLKDSLRCANPSRASVKPNADRAESELEVLEKVTSDLFEETKENKQQLEEATSKAESLQSKPLEANKTSVLLKKNLDDYNLANKRFQENLAKKTSQIKHQAESEELVTPLRVAKVEIDIQRAKAIELIQAVDGKQSEKLEKCLYVLLTHANQWDWRDHEKYSVFDVKRGNIKNRLSTIHYPIAYIFDKDPNWKGKCIRLPLAS